MKIVSKRKDYYDYLGQIYGVDDKVFYKRNPKEYSPENFDGIHSYSSDKVSATLNGIWFCDTWCDLVIVKYGTSYLNDEEVFYYYDYEAFERSWRHLIKWTDHSAEFIKKFFKGSSKEKLNTKYGSPQLIVLGNTILTDIILKDYDFQKVIGPQQAFQRVAMFIAAKPDPPQTIPTDLDRFEAKGFDRKTSFRNM